MIHGRRRLLLFSLAMFSLLSGLTALSWNITSFAALKFLTVAFSAQGSIAVVILVEEVNADVRGLAVVESFRSDGVGSSR
jgi:MFS family permease